MNPLYLLANFVAGFLMCLCIPLLTAGLTGISYRSVVGNSRPWVNFLLGTLSLFLGLFLLSEVRFPFNINISSILFWIAFLLTGFWLSNRRLP